jgi:hypothetical protein
MEITDHSVVLANRIQQKTQPTLYNFALPPTQFFVQNKTLAIGSKTIMDEHYNFDDASERTL